jgi:hypothetical protein
VRALAGRLCDTPRHDRAGRVRQGTPGTNPRERSIGEASRSPGEEPRATRCAKIAPSVPAGRPPLLTPARIAEIGRLRDEGLHPDEIAKLTRLSRRSVYRALAAVPPAEVALAPSDASSLLDDPRLEGALVGAIAAAARRDWRAAAWILERRWPDRWGRVEVRPLAEAEDDRDVFRVGGPDDPFSELDELAARRARQAPERPGGG